MIVFGSFKKRRSGVNRAVPDALLPHLAPLGWQYVNLTGDHLWTATAPREVRTFCGTLHATGCRISESLALTARQVDLTAG